MAIVLAVDDGGAEDEGVGVGVEDQGFAVELALAVDAEGVGGVVFEVGAGVAVEDVLGGEVDEGEGVLAGVAGEDGGATGVDPVGEVGLDSQPSTSVMPAMQ